MLSKFTFDVWWDAGLFELVDLSSEESHEVFMFFELM